MDFPVIVDVVLGIIVVYFISSVCLSFITNYIISRRNWKGDFLYEQLQHIFSSASGSNAAFIERIYKHPLIDSLKQYNYRKPEKIDADLFAQTVMAVIRDLDQEVLLLKQKELEQIEIQKEVTKNEDLNSEINYLKEIIEYGDFRSIKFNNVFIDGMGSKLLSTVLFPVNEYKEGIEAIKNWYSNFVERTQFLFSRMTKWYLFFYAFIFSIILNVDTLKIYKTLYHDESSRAKLVVMAGQLTAAGEEKAIIGIESIITKHLDDNIANEVINDTVHISIDHVYKIQDGIAEAYGDANLLIWWKESPWKTLKSLYNSDKENVFYHVFLKLLGLLISSMALMYGAPFWYDFMKKMISIRQNITLK